MSEGHRWGPVDPIFLSLYPVFRIAFWRPKRAACNCVQRMRTQATGSTALSDSIIYPSFCPYICLSTGLLIFLYLYQFPVWGSSVAMHLSPLWGPKDPCGFHLSLYVCVSVCPVIHIAFWRSFAQTVIVCSACGLRPQGQTT